MGLEIEFPCPIHRVAAGPAGPLLVQLDDRIVAVEPNGRRHDSARRYGGETLIASTQDGRAMVMAQDRRIIVCEPGGGVTSRSLALCNLGELMGGEACPLGARALTGGRIAVLVGVTDPRAETNISCDIRAVILGGAGVEKVFPPLGSRVPRLWGVDEKRGVVMAGSLPDPGLCARVGMESGERLADEPWLQAKERGPRVVHGDCTSEGRWCLLVEEHQDSEEPEAPPKRSLWIMSNLGIASEARVDLGPEVDEVRAVKWSPDGSRAAIRTDRSVLLFRVGGKKLEPLCNAGPGSEVVWWPGAGGIAVVEGRTLRVVG